MSFHNTMQIDGDPSKTIRFGVGFVHEIMPQFSDAEQERIRREEAREQEQLTRETEARAAAEVPDMPAWMIPERHTVSEKLSEVAAAQNRENRRRAAKAAQAHSFECGCDDCSNRLAADGPVGAPRSLPSIVAEGEGC